MTIVTQIRIFTSSHFGVYDGTINVASVSRFLEYGNVQMIFDMMILIEHQNLFHHFHLQIVILHNDMTLTLLQL